MIFPNFPRSDILVPRRDSQPPSKSHKQTSIHEVRVVCFGACRALLAKSSNLSEPSHMPAVGCKEHFFCHNLEASNMWKPQHIIQKKLAKQIMPKVSTAKYQHFLTLRMCCYIKILLSSQVIYIGTAVFTHHKSCSLQILKVRLCTACFMRSTPCAFAGKPYFSSNGMFSTMSPQCIAKSRWETVQKSGDFVVGRLIEDLACNVDISKPAPSIDGINIQGN